MKKYLLLAMQSLLGLALWAQTPSDTINLKVENVELDLLKTPTNPAFIIMNTTPTEIVEPGSAPEFYTTLQNASDNFSAIPNNFAFSVTPFWWMKGAKDLSFEKDFESENTLRFFRTLQVSGGVFQDEIASQNVWRYGLGLTSTLLRGKVDEEKKKKYLKALREYHEQVYGQFDEYRNENPGYKSLQSKRDEVLRDLRISDSLSEAKLLSPDQADSLRKVAVVKLQVINNELKTLQNKLLEEYEEDKELLQSSEYVDKMFSALNDRKGFKLDIGGGISYNSLNNKLDDTNLYRAGIWTNFGGSLISSDSAASGLEAYFLGRYLFYDQINYLSEDNTVTLINNLSTFDAGAKLQYELKGKFTLGFEAIYRIGLSGDVYENTYKLNGLVQYQLDQNKYLYASLGNNINDSSTEGPEDLVVRFGINVGFGGDVNIYDLKL